MMMDAPFFASIRASLFHGSMTQHQVDGLTMIGDAFGVGDMRCLAYIMATAYHETAFTMQPIAEYGHGHGHPYGVSDFTGKAPYGRGFVQLTWRRNYLKADAELMMGGRLAADYDLALDPRVAANILVRGMTEGWFTGKKLADYIGVRCDYIDARRIINGVDRAVAIAAYAVKFQAAFSTTK